MGMESFNEVPDMPAEEGSKLVNDPVKAEEMAYAGDKDRSSAARQRDLAAKPSGVYSANFNGNMSEISNYHTENAESDEKDAERKETAAAEAFEQAKTEVRE